MLGVQRGEIIHNEEVLNIACTLGAVIRDTLGSVYVHDLDLMQRRQWFEAGREFAEPIVFPVIVLDNPQPGDAFV